MKQHYGKIFIGIIGLSFILLWAMNTGRIAPHPAYYYLSGLLQGVSWVFFILQIINMRAAARARRK